MMYGFCNLALMPVRAAANHRSEMVTQLLFGEAYQITDTCSNAGWIKIKTDFDHYEGFLDIHLLSLLHSSVYCARYVTKEYSVAQEPVQVWDVKRNLGFTVPVGSTLVTNASGKISLGNEHFILPPYSPPTKDNILRRLISVADSFLNAPYLWGGRTVYGIDCSGFIQVIFKTIGIPLPRDGYQQARLGELVEDIADVRTGDLAFFGNKEGKITHVALVKDERTVIHASGKVRLDTLDKHGIYCIERSEYSHQLKHIKRMLTE